MPTSVKAVCVVRPELRHAVASAHLFEEMALAHARMLLAYECVDTHTQYICLGACFERMMCAIVWTGMPQKPIRVTYAITANDIKLASFRKGR